MKFSIKSIDILTENLCYTDYIIVTEEISNLELEIERLNSIIKEVRECINHFAIENEDYSKIYNDEEKELLEILDKANSKIKEIMPVEELEEYEPKNMAEQEYQDWFWD